SSRKKGRADRFSQRPGVNWSYWQSYHTEVVGDVAEGRDQGCGGRRKSVWTAKQAKMREKRETPFAPFVYFRDFRVPVFFRDLRVPKFFTLS
ncbi:MAG TPA: hypothetical protein VJ182_03085, partial [Anaerolineales bacterium]|nr:hypothetical protein [Anaerolineales bacterium]